MTDFFRSSRITSTLNGPHPFSQILHSMTSLLRCDYHRDHGHKTNRCLSLKFMVEKLIKAVNLRRYIRETVRVAKVAPAVERITIGVELPPEPWSTINYILGGPTNDQYKSKCQKKRLLRAATIRARINSIHAPDSSRVVQPIDDPISFPHINPSRVIIPHHDALVLTLCINDFDVHKVLVDSGSTADLLQLPAFKQMNISSDRLSLAGIILSGFNGATIVTMGDITLPVRAGSVVQ